MRAPVLFLLVGLSGFGWHAFADQARAAHVLGCLLTMACLLMLRSGHGRAVALVAMFGAGIEAMGAACGIWYEVLSSQAIGVCDEGTGRPVLAMVGVGALFVAAEVLRGLQHDAQRGG